MGQRQKALRAIARGSVLALVVVAASADYIVKPGDTISGIAARHAVTVSALVDANEISNPDLILVGQELDIPTEPGASAPEGETERYHTVRPGETLERIAAEYGLSLSELVEANAILNPALIYVGTRLNLSGKAFVAGGDSGMATHAVSAGESLSGIAARYGISASAIAAANQLNNPDLIQAGTTLRIPGSGWVCPVENSSYVNSWGFPRSGGRSHEGTDMFAPRNTAVRAPVSGQVEQLTGSVGGYQFRLYGDDGNIYIGSHMESAEASGRVNAGSVLGYVGNSGNAAGTETHLHFDVHPNGGSADNPYPTLQANSC